MFFLSKLIQSALLPSNDIAFIAILGILALLLWRKGIGIGLLVVATFLLAVAGWSPLGPALVTALEDRFPAPQMPASVAGIVMLGGAVDIHISEDRGSVAVNDNAERIFAVAALARHYPDARILLSGGIAHTISDQAYSESEGGRRLLVDLGVPEARIELEERSRTTFENAIESVAAAKPRPSENWLLVTSAYNMPRAVASFRAANFPIIPYPVDYRTRPRDLRRPVSTIAGGLDFTDIAAHEWLGLLAYRVTGKTTEILPAPGE